MLNESIKRFPENKFCLSIFLLLLVFCTNPSLNVGSLWSKSQVQTCRISFNEKQLISSSSNIQQLKNKTSPYSPNHVGSPTNLHFLGLLLTGWQGISWATRVSHPHLVEVAIAQGGVELLAANNEVPGPQVPQVAGSWFIGILIMAEQMIPIELGLFHPPKQP